MDFFNQNSIENGILICNKTEHQQPLIELLYESKKRTGGDDIKELHFDKALNQFLCVYYKPETSRHVLKNGPVTFNQTVFMPTEIDRTKIILENVDEFLDMDVVSLYAEYLFQDVTKRDPGVRLERFKSGFVMVDLDCFYDIERLKLRHRKRNKLQNKEIILHFVAKHDSCVSLYSQVLNSVKKPVINCTPDVKLNIIPASKQSKESSPSCPSLVLIQDSDEETSISTSSAYSAASDSVAKSTKSVGSSLNEQPSTSNSVRTLEMRIRMFEGLVNGLRRVLDVSDDSARPKSSCQQSKPDQNGAESSLDKSVVTVKQSAEFAPPMITANKVTNSTAVPPVPSRTGLVRVRNIVQEGGNPVVSRRPMESMSAVIQPNRSIVTQAATVNSQHLRRMILSAHHSSTSGLNLSMIARFPIIKYRRPGKETNSCASTKCSICLESFKESQDVRLLSCFHQFHVECIDTWLMEKSTCPTCKFNLTQAFTKNE